MKELTKAQLLDEAKAQTNALKTIKRWLMYAIGVSTMGAALIYAGFAGAAKHTALGVTGIILTILSVTAAIVINLGLKKGGRNVERILKAAESK